MYSVSQLAKMYNCTRPTIYNKFKQEELKEFLFNDKRGLRLSPEGLNLFNVIMSESNVKTDLHENDTETNTIVTDTQERYITSLLAQIDELKHDKEFLKHELAEQRKAFLNAKPPERKGILHRFFSKI